MNDTMFSLKTHFNINYCKRVRVEEIKIVFGFHYFWKKKIIIIIKKI